jgi:exonuclease SbcC
MTESQESEERNEIKTQENNLPRSSFPALTSRPNIAINNDMKYFKNELLKEMKKIKQELFVKFSEYSLQLNEKIKQTSIDNEQLDQKIEYISKNIDDKITSFLNEKNKYNFDRIISDLKDNIMTNDIKIQTMREELRQHKEQYEEVVKSNIYYQGMIGSGCKYRNMHQFIDFLISSLNELNSTNNQKASEMRLYKTKVENIFHNINGQLNDITFGYKSYINQCMKDYETKISSQLRIYDEKFLELKTHDLENKKGIERKLSDYNEKYKTLNKLENNININNEKLLEDIKLSNNNLEKKMELYQQEFDEIKTKFQELLKYNEEIKSKLNSLNLFSKKKIINKDETKNEDYLFNNDILNSEFDMGNKKYKNQSTETLGVNYSEKKENSKNVNNNNISRIYLKIGGRKYSKDSRKILKNERLEKFKYIYENENNNYDNKLFNKSLDSTQSINQENNKNEYTRIKSSIPGIHTNKKKLKNKIDNYSSKDLYNTGLFVNFNSKCEEDNYINNLKNNALCLKLLEKGIKIDLSKSTINPGEYFLSSKNMQKKKLKNNHKDKNFFNMSFNKKRESNYDGDKYHEYINKGDNDILFAINNPDNGLIFRNPNSKLKIKNLSAIE